MRVVLVVREEGGKWKKQYKIADEKANQIPPNTGPSDVNDLDAWFAAGWRVVSGSGLPLVQPVLQADDSTGAIRQRVSSALTRDSDRLVLVLEHD